MRAEIKQDISIVILGAQPCAEARLALFLRDVRSSHHTMVGGLTIVDFEEMEDICQYLNLVACL